MWEVILDCIVDTLKLFPFLFVLYVLIELMEHRTRMGKPNRALTGRAAPLVGGAMGLIPMCGFSVMAAKLYERKYLTLGTLFSVFIATSDEAFLVIALSALSVREKVISIAAMCAIKLLLGVVVGFALDLVANRRAGRAGALADADGHAPLHDEAHCAHEHVHDHAQHGEEGGELHACEHRHAGALQLYVLSPLLHALRIAAIVLLINFAFGLLFYYIGEDCVIDALQHTGYWFQPVICAAIGMIPNCASSVVLAETFAMGGIAFGSCLGGLVTNAGLGVLVLFRNRRAWKRNLVILAAMFVLGVLAGYLVNALSLVVM